MDLPGAPPHGEPGGTVASLVQRIFASVVMDAVALVNSGGHEEAVAPVELVEAPPPEVVAPPEDQDAALVRQIVGQVFDIVRAAFEEAERPPATVESITAAIFARVVAAHRPSYKYPKCVAHGLQSGGSWVVGARHACDHHACVLCTRRAAMLSARYGPLSTRMPADLCLEEPPDLRWGEHARMRAYVRGGRMHAHRRTERSRISSRRDLDKRIPYARGLPSDADPQLKPSWAAGGRFGAQAQRQQQQHPAGAHGGHAEGAHAAGAGAHPFSRSPAGGALHARHATASMCCLPCMHAESCRRIYA
jgi:hypothetical protein